MSKDKRKYLEAYIPEVKPKETPKRSGMKSDGRLDEIEEAIRAFNDLLTKQSRDNLDAMYNIDMDNMSSSMRRLFKSYDDGITKAQAEIKTWADAQEAGFNAVAEWQNETNSSISSLEGKADANSASIMLLNQWKGETSSSLSAVESLASQNEASITLLNQWKSGADEEIEGLVATTAVIKSQADSNGASIEQIVTAVGEDGKVTAASIAVAISEDESFIELIADKVNIEGYVTFESLMNDGESVINGNNISLILNGDGDDGSTSIESESALNFIYKHYRSSKWQEKEFASLYTSVAGDDSDETSRYALNINANRFVNDLGETVYASLKMDAAGRVSIKGQYGVYIGTYWTDGYVTLDAADNTRVIANKAYSSLSNSSGSNIYSFNTDGLYYGSKKLLGTDGSGGGSSVAVFG